MLRSWFSYHFTLIIDGSFKGMEAVTPAKAGVQTFCKCSKNLDSGFRRNDRKGHFTKVSMFNVQ
jgi:hypothetical protein